MPRIANLIPLPGVGDLESIAKTLIALLKNEGVDTNKGAALTELLESMTEWASKIEKLAEFTTELHKIQTDRKAASTSKSRQRKLAIWDDLTAELQQKMMCTTLNLVAQLHEARTEQAVSRPHEHEIIDSYRIANDVERHTRIWPEPKHQEYYHTLKPVRITLRSGRLGKMAVSYLTFTEVSDGAAHEASS
ncbi:hypothetical protein BDV93DRAFT_557288 [Ceratobasidium sp. AG-I]|nr:hypothetical protein BDV93DRAFT_557288 [Ceratobasidium sp. AG-I]